MVGWAWVEYLLGQGNKLLHGVESEFGAEGWTSRHKRSRRDGNTQGHVLAKGDKDVVGTTLGIANLAHGETPPEERVGRVGDFDLGQRVIGWVIERGSTM